MKLDLRANGPKLYKVLRYIKVHNLVKNGAIDQKMLGLWVKWEGGDHVLREGDTLLICETIQDIDYEEVN